MVIYTTGLLQPKNIWGLRLGLGLELYLGNIPPPPPYAVLIEVTCIRISYIRKYFWPPTIVVSINSGNIILIFYTT